LNPIESPENFGFLARDEPKGLFRYSLPFVGNGTESSNPFRSANESGVSAILRRDARNSRVYGHTFVTVQKPATTESAADAHQLRNGDTQRLIAEAVKELSVEDTRNPSHVYARILRKAIQKRYMLDELHLGDVLVFAMRGMLSTTRQGCCRSLIPPASRGQNRATIRSIA